MIFPITVLLITLFSSVSFSDTCDNYKRADKEMYTLIEKLIPGRHRTEIRCDETLLKKWCAQATDPKNKFLCEFQFTTKIMATTKRWSVSQNRHLETLYKTDDLSQIELFFDKHLNFASYICTTNNLLKSQVTSIASLCHEINRGRDPVCLNLKKKSKEELLKMLDEYKKRIEFNKNYKQCVQSEEPTNNSSPPLQ